MAETLIMSWTSLAVELREMILAATLQEVDKVAPLASVCLEWQTYIEKENFSRLELTTPRLLNLNGMTT